MMNDSMKICGKDKEDVQFIIHEWINADHNTNMEKKESGISLVFGKHLIATCMWMKKGEDHT